MKSNTEIPFVRYLIENAKNYTVMDDGQFIFAIETGTLNEWERVNGFISTSSNEYISASSNSYEQFCKDMVPVGESLIGIIGSKEQMDLCEDLIDNGASIRIM